VCAHGRLTRLISGRLAERGLSLRSLARAAGVSHSSVSRLLAGRARPTPGLLLALAPALGLSAEELLSAAGLTSPEAGDVLAALRGLGLDPAPPELVAQVRTELGRLRERAGSEQARALARRHLAPRLAALGARGPVAARLQALGRLYLDGERLPGAVRAAAGSAVLYFLQTADAIADSMWPIGYLDDAVAVALAEAEVRRLLGAAGGWRPGGADGAGEGGARPAAGDGGARPAAGDAAVRHLPRPASGAEGGAGSGPVGAGRSALPPGTGGAGRRRSPPAPRAGALLPPLRPGGAAAGAPRAGGQRPAGGEPGSPGGRRTAMVPPTRREVVVDEMHGERIEDPYRWLEDSDSPEVAAWTDAQNRATRAALDPLPERAAMAARLRELMDCGSVSAPQAVAGHLFYQRRAPGQNQPVLCKDGRPILDPNAASAGGTVALDWWWPSPDGRFVAYGLSEHGDEWSTLHVLDTATGERLAEAIPRTRYASVVWDPDGSGFHYTRYPNPGEVPPGEEFYGRKVYHHRLGTPHAEDAPVFGQDLPIHAMVSVRGSGDGRHLLYTVNHGWSRTDLYLDGRPLLVGRDALYEARMVGASLYLMTNEGAPRWKLVDGEGREILPEGRDVLQAFAVAGEYIVASYLRDAAARLTVHRRGDGALLHEVALPDPFGTVHELAADPDRPEAFFTYSSFSRPPALLRLDCGSGATDTVVAVRAPVDPAAVEVRREFCASRDGTRVPVFVVRPAGLPPGPVPTVLTGYGGFNIARTPAWDPAIHAWIEPGRVFALACLRGGSEYGETWHRAGMRQHKQNVFDDLVAAAEHLCRAGYTTPRLLGVEGRSNGGLLAGAALTQRPDLFGAVVAGVPLLDMLRFDRFLIAALWTSEYGAPADPEAYRWLRAYSPYHHVRDGVAYPAVLLFTAASDTRVHPMHARKMAARLQAATGSGRPVLLRVEFEAGHGVGKPVHKVVDEQADVWGFLAWQLRA
jgi:prolyl oligopeptidase